MIRMLNESLSEDEKYRLYQEYTDFAKRLNSGEEPYVKVHFRYIDEAVLDEIAKNMPSFKKETVSIVPSTGGLEDAIMDSMEQSINLQRDRYLGAPETVGAYVVEDASRFWKSSDPTTQYIIDQIQLAAEDEYDIDYDDSGDGDPEWDFSSYGAPTIVIDLFARENSDFENLIVSSRET